MKSKFMIALAAVGLLAFTSCEKCEDCDLYIFGEATGETQEFCGDELDAAKEAFVLGNGWKCN